MKTLILIDFQTYYLSTMPKEKRKELIENVKKISRVFMVNDWPIIIVYFASTFDDNDLIKEMRDILEYKNSILVTKNKCDGSTEILDAIDLNRFSLDVVIGGVFGDECVSETINGLMERDRKISVSMSRDLVWPNGLVIDQDHENRVEIHNNQSELVIV
jgi:nicotinamidase-related amidase